MSGGGGAIFGHLGGNALKIGLKIRWPSTKQFGHLAENSTNIEISYLAI
jgi:hypothetical protein